MTNHLDTRAVVLPWVLLWAGLVSGGVARMVTAPLDVVKIRLQLQTTGYYRGIAHTLVQVVRDEGVRGLWKGNVPAELLYVLYGATQFLVYLAVCAGLNQTRVPDSWHPVAAGMAAGAASTVTTYPFDLLRTRLAASRSGTRLVATVRQLYGESGVRAFYGGMLPTLLLVALNSGAMFHVYGAARRVAEQMDAPYAEAACGLVAGGVAKGLVFPLDLLRRRMQMGALGAWATARGILLRDGPRGFYRGFLVSVLKTGPTSAISMWTYEQTVGWLQRND